LKDLTTGNMPLGTVGYMSPEQIAGKPLDERSDLFSYGVTLYEMATGRLPFDRDTEGSTYGAILHEPADPPSKWNPQISPPLDAIVVKALEKDRSLRYQRAAEILTDLQPLKRDTESGHISGQISRSVVLSEVATPSRATRQKLPRLRERHVRSCHAFASDTTEGAQENRDSCLARPVACGSDWRRTSLLSCAPTEQAPHR
jgi:serine/threonine protein kinase